MMHDWYVARVWHLSEEQAATLAKSAERWVTDLPSLDPEAESEGFVFACGRCGLGLPAGNALGVV
jgi:hypothetical protein